MIHLRPGSSPYYDQTLIYRDAASPRAPGSVVLSRPSSFREDYQLQIAYRKYVTTRRIPHNAKRINFLFLHGNGMNKGIWHYQIHKLFAMYEISFPDMYIDTIIAADHVNMGDSAYVNRGKLGHVSDWNDFAKDYIMLTKIHEKDTFLHPNAFNVIVGHSMGGFLAIQITASEPNLFQSSILINPVCVDVSPEALPMFNQIYKNWYDQGFVKFYFDNLDKHQNWYHEIYEHYTKRSFYKNFDPIVLRNMLEDEIPCTYDRQKHYSTVELKHNGLEDFINYFHSNVSIESTRSSYKQVKVPTKILCGDKDTLAELIKNNINGDLKFGRLQILENQYHNMHAESPELIMSLVNDFVLESYRNHPKLNDFEYSKKYGKDYKEKLRKDALKGFLDNERVIPSKL
ncbi:LPX1 Peroxisomal membrane protein LPX1 [Candida maltosa Xu316]|uniref:Peroxisomal matrix lipase, putative n=1 Tax=Candida maltosa (strain Xu316) TaxID=1245528 RepID=M3HG81_CANMX|nr:Peroxisomal matrix lipase, putative [Candida maltosa Xu316]